MDERDYKAMNELKMSNTEETDKLSAEEFIISKEVFDGMVYSPLHKREFKLSELLHEYAVLFTKYHVRECKEATKGKAELKYGKDGCLYINPDSIENAYSEDEIK